LKKNKVGAMRFTQRTHIKCKSIKNKDTHKHCKMTNSSHYEIGGDA